MSTPVTFTLDADGVGWIVFDSPGSRANVFNPATQAALARAIAAAATSGASAVVVQSAKDRIFIAGADLKWLESLPDEATSASFSRTGQSLFQQLANLKKPVVCAIHGACAGGGYELALACQWRVASDDAATQIGLPEIGLGTIPGWGGGTRLPRLIGAAAALDHMLRAKLLPAREALAAGLVDEVAPPSELKHRAKAAALRLARPDRAVTENASPSPPGTDKTLPRFAPGRTVDPRPSPPATPSGYFEELRRATGRKFPGQQPAPLILIDVVEQSAGLDLATALEIEARAFGRVTAGEVCKNLVHVFFLRNAAKKRSLEGWFPPPLETPPPLRRIGVVGAGVMGSGIAQALAAGGYEVVLRDVQPALAERGLGVVHGLFDDAVKRGKLSAGAARIALDRVTATTTWDGFSTCDLVIEAIVEDVAAKRKLFSELAGVVRPDTLLASNTSALPIEEIAGHVSHPERTLGLHFFNPVSRMALVELIVASSTSAETAARALSLTQSLGKLPVIARSSPGFLMTRVLFFYLNEAVRLWEQGVPAGVLDGALRDFGWPMGPLRLIDEVGVDVSDFIFRELAAYFPQRFVATTTCGALLAAGLKGRKNGAGNGFYRYQDNRETANESVPRPPSAAPRRLGPSPSAITDRLMGVMIDEARRCLDEGVVRSPDDVDFAFVTGAGFPAFRGGLLRYARSIGRFPAASDLDESSASLTGRTHRPGAPIT